MSVVAESLRTCLPGINITCFFPQAFEKSSGVVEWWTLDMSSLAMSLIMGGPKKFIETKPPRLDACRDMWKETLKQILDLMHMTAEDARERVFLGGFSQGAMTALDLSLELHALGTPV